MANEEQSWFDQLAPTPAQAVEPEPKRGRKKAAKEPKAPKAPKAPVRGQRLEDVEVKTWRPKWAQHERNNKKGDVADAVRSLGIMLSTSRGETVPLATLAEQYKGTVLGSAFGRIYQTVQSGKKGMAEAFREEDKVFPKIVGDLLLVGSRSGSAAANLQKAADILDDGQDLSHKIRSALLQPLVLLIIIIVFLYGVILFVLPVFSGMFASFGRPLPPLSQAIMATGNAIAWGGGGIALLIVLWILYFKIWGKDILALRIWLGRLVLKVPVVGNVIRAQKLTQVFSILSGLLSVGMSEHDALETAAEAAGNYAIRDHLLRHVQEMDRGTVGFADVADGFLIPLQAGFMLRNGFDSGSEVQALTDLAKTYQRDANRRADNLANRLEPIANGVVGVIFTFVIVATYLPVYDLFSGLTAI